MLRGIIFDFDGTMVDTESLIYEAVRDFIAEEYRLSYSKTVYQLSVGQSDELFFDNLEKIIGTEIDKKLLNQRIRMAQQTGYCNLPLRPGIESIISQAKLQDQKLAVVSNSSKEELNYFFDYQPELKNQFDKIVTIEDVSNGKPDPESYLACLSSLHLATHETIAIEDSPVGSSAAIAANLTTLIYPNEFTKNMEFPKEGKICLNILEAIKDQKQQQTVNKNAQL
ncbi:HAD family hydrolase [Enterococcus pallens]|uniref:HAD hydrolase, family IA n=1 Tax=Enterococcus pallens ATCC BAA-351 TaxID=1158607 RepID=R2T4T0_9ENTE|nr:HAD-IA family hydrolase [Enterococcus pallens]EOH95264.1 HAD hydrolase, family IA [Enterococcus pallens ATCC BAA-351]EOU21599.1 hypothetical protein I588_02446 [Enterococcus pallens ATCC BAA-351]OJG79755.1 HAD hydrolase, family IA [Enterococcus pallens]